MAPLLWSSLEEAAEWLHVASGRSITARQLLSEAAQGSLPLFAVVPPGTYAFRAQPSTTPRAGRPPARGVAIMDELVEGCVTVPAEIAERLLALAGLRPSEGIALSLALSDEAHAAQIREIFGDRANTLQLFSVDVLRIRDSDLVAYSEALNSGHPQAPTRPSRAMDAQDDAILHEIRRLGFEPREVPSKKAGVSGIKSVVRKALCGDPFQSTRLFRSQLVFDKSWRRLTQSGRVATRQD